MSFDEEENARDVEKVENEHAKRMNERRVWLENLKTGDEVAVVSSGFYGTPEFKYVERTTATLIIVQQRRYERSTGSESGKSGSRGLNYKLVPPTQENRDKARKAKLAHRIGKAVFDKMSLDTLEAVYAQIKEEMPFLSVKEWDREDGIENG